ncbi:DNA-3-methyladenine glycosylase family protein [Helcococcus kunzii]|uniref:DNA-3-methyladenine glycosylase family protein n=1 Tax=Helcococcus kunzii TaxID=40091 RepID=UPI0021A8DE91|nr:DNA glycosylase [Helcococcus kunzii]MCT1795839.1 8-oxoguanine DNA glycosylase [Helcococcus kunzii]MCT1989888.1 8-oxoguanine DNA glycosylase [Helcococcus kunzii]
MENYIIEEFDGGIKVKGLKNFDLTHIFECGQAFRWVKTVDNSYIIVAYGRVIELIKDASDDLIIYNTNKEDFLNIWHNYFDLNRDYDSLKLELAKTAAYKLNTSLKEAIEFGYGIRILRQEEFEMIISFIISANNQIPRIKNSIRLLSETYGEFIQEYKGQRYYSFPTPEKLASADPLEIKEICRVGFRNERIVLTSRLYLENPENFSNQLDDQTLGDNLLALPGVGPKVRDCILLFGYARGNTFPVDVWVKRLMETLYIKKTIPNKQILIYSEDLFGEHKGIAQQYLFYYARENKIGK